MSKKDAMPVPEKGESTPGSDAPRVWNEESIDILMSQFRYMLAHEVKNMKLEVVENMGAMLARRSGIDREIHDLSARVDRMARAIDGFGARLMRIEKGKRPIARARGPLGHARDLTATAPESPRKAPATPPPAPEAKGKKRGRPKGSGFYSRKRLAMEKGAQS
jgi:hypothetical protein